MDTADRLEPWVGVIEVAEHLGVSKSWVNKAVGHKVLPVKRVGRALRFRLSEIDAWIVAGNRDLYL